MIYLDFFILVNLGMNFFILWLVSLACSRSTSRPRLLWGAGAGTLPAVLYFSAGAAGAPLWWLLVLATPVLMLEVAFHPLKITELPPLLGVTFGAAFLLAGVVHALLTFGNMGAEGYSVNGWWLLGSCLLVFILLRLFRPYLEDKKWQSSLRVQVEVSMGEKSRLVSAMLDTGNRLRDPFGQRPVILVDYRQLEEILPQTLRLKFREGVLDPIKVLEKMVDHPEAGRFYLIPFTGVKGESDMLLGFRPDKITVYWKGESLEVSSRAALGLYGKAFGPREEFQALMPPEIIQMAG